MSVVHLYENRGQGIGMYILAPVGENPSFKGGIKEVVPLQRMYQRAIQVSERTPIPKAFSSLVVSEKDMVVYMKTAISLSALLIGNTLFSLIFLQNLFKFIWVICR